MQILKIFKAETPKKCKDPFQVMFFIINLCLSHFYFGYTLVYISAVDFTVIMKVYQIDFDQSVAQGLLQGITPIGGGIGALSAAFFIQRFSRKYTISQTRNYILALNALAIVLTILTLVPNYKMFFLVRFLQGCCAGLYSSIVPTFNKQFTPMEMSTLLGAFNNLFIAIGFFIAYLFALILGSFTGDYSGASHWQAIFLFPLVTLFWQTYKIYRVYPFETPKYLAINKQFDEMRRLLEHIYKEEEVGKIYDDVLKMNGTMNVDESGDKPQTKQQSKSAIFYALYLALSGPFIGPNICFSYGGDIVSGIVPNLKIIMPTLLMMENMLAGVFCLYFLNIYGRKAITLFGFLVCGICLMGITIGYFIAETSAFLAQLLIVFGLLLFLLTIGFTLSPITWMYIPEVVQPHLVGFPVMVNWLSASVVMIIFPIALEHLPNHNPGYVFICFSVVAFISIFFTQRIMVETKDRSQTEILKDFYLLDTTYFKANQEKEDMTTGDTLEMKLIEKNTTKKSLGEF